MNKWILGFSLLVTTQSELLAQHANVTQQYDPGSVMRDHPLDFVRMRLDVAFEPEKGLVKGTIVHRFHPIRDKVDSFFLDGPGIDIKSATLNGVPVRYTTSSEGITFFPAKSLTLNEDDSLTLVYEAYPKRGIYFIGWNDPNNLSRKQIWTQGQGTDNRHWFPCYDTPNDKLITEVTVKFDKDYKVLSNGVKVQEKSLKDGTKLWHYRMSHPHASYLVMLGIGKYDVRETKSKSGVPLRQWYYPEWKDRYDFTYKYNEQIFNFLESEIGVPYGWESYSQIPVQDFMYGAMENTSATLFGDFFCTDERGYNDRNYVAVNAHELAHQWFGDMVTARSPNSHWLQESFATHYNITAEREVFGQEHFDWARRSAYNSAINTTDKKSISHSQTPTALIYQKGSVVLQMLKYVTGRDAFNRTVKRYLLAHKYENVDGEDLLNAFQDELGMPLEWFWDQWVVRGGEPAYNVTFDDLKNGSNRFTQFVVSQTQPVNELMGLFKMPIVFAVHYTDGTSEQVIEWIEKETQVVRVPNTGNKEIAFVLFDPNSQVLKTVSFDKPFEMLKAQALSKADMLDRYDAVCAMRNIPTDKKRDILKKTYETSTFHAIKVEIATQLLNDSKSDDIVRMALHDKDPLVKKGIATSTKTIDRSLMGDYETLLLDSSYTTIVQTLEKLCNDFPENTAKYLEITKGIEGTNGRNVLIKWLEISLSINSDQANRDQLAAFSSDSYEFITRVNAMGALQRLGIYDDQILKNCIEAALSSNGRLARPAAETIRYFYGQNRYKRQVSQGIAGYQGSESDKEKLRKLLD